MSIPESLESSLPMEDKEQASPAVVYVYIDDVDTLPVKVRRIGRREANAIDDARRVTELIAPLLLKIEAAMNRSKSRPED